MRGRGECGSSLSSPGPARGRVPSSRAARETAHAARTRPCLVSTSSMGASKMMASEGRRIMRKWEGFGWCMGEIVRVNDDARRSIGGDKVNFFAHYEIDGEDENDVPHVLYTCSSSTSTGRRTTPSTTRGSCWSRSSHPEEKGSGVRWRPVRQSQKSRRQQRWRWTPHSAA